MSVDAHGIGLSVLIFSQHLTQQRTSYPRAFKTLRIGRMSRLDRPADVVLRIDGMMCQKNCASTVQTALKNLSIVEACEVSHSKKEAEIWIYESIDTIDPLLLIDTVECIGYDASIKFVNGSLVTTTDTSTPGVPITTIPSTKDTLPSKSSENVPDFIFKINNLKPKDTRKIESLLSTIDGVINISVEEREKVVRIWGFAEEATLLQTLKQNKFDASNALKPMVPSSAVQQQGQLLTNKSPISKKTLVRNNSLPSKTTKEGKREFLYEIRGMSCGACATKIENSLKELPGVLDCIVSIMTHQGKVILSDSTTTDIIAVGPRDLLEKIQSLGYESTLIDNQNPSLQNAHSMIELSKQELQTWQRLLILSLVFGVPVLLLHMFGHITQSITMVLMSSPSFIPICGDGISLEQWLMLIFNFPMLVFVGYKYYKSALIGAYYGNLGMDFLVMIGTFITFLYSFVQFYESCTTGIATENMFFETSGMLLLFVTVGKYIESYAKGKSASSVIELMKLQPQEAYLVSGNSSMQLNNPTEEKPSIQDQDISKIALDLIQKDDILRVLPGDRIPTDGIIILGRSYIDESMITGESNPILKGKGDVVFGSTVNTDNCIYIIVTSYGSESTLAQIVRLVESAQMNKAPVQQYADRLAGIFTPIILFLAMCTFMIWYSLSITHIIPVQWFQEEYNDPFLFSLLFGISVVVVSCPCALGLATPTAIMVGTAVGASNGILIKGGAAFEIAHKVDTIVFDKTGTLTEGKPMVTDEIPFDTKPNHMLGSNTSQQMNANTIAIQRLLLLAATAEQTSSHPLAKAVLNAASNKGILPLPLLENACISYVGSGISCTCSLGIILIGNRQFMNAQSLVVNAAADSIMWNLEIQGKTAVVVALNNEIVGILGIADIPKPEADLAIKALKAMGMDVWMLTGDNPTTAESLANILEIPRDRVMASMLPQDKVAKVKELQLQGKIVGFIGDGINDSPALVQADIGVAIGCGTQIAIESASMVLIKNNLIDLVVGFDLAKVVFRRIQWNFLWALIYNVIAIPYAAGIWFPLTKTLLPPHYAGLAMALSSISVVISSMMLKWYTRPAGLLAMQGDTHLELTSKSGCGCGNARCGSIKAQAGGGGKGENRMNCLVTPCCGTCCCYGPGCGGSSGSMIGGGKKDHYSWSGRAFRGGYDQLPVTDNDEDEGEDSLGIELGISNNHHHHKPIHKPLSPSRYQQPLSSSLSPASSVTNSIKSRLHGIRPQQQEEEEDSSDHKTDIMV